MTDEERPDPLGASDGPAGRPVGEHRLLPSLTILVLIALPFGLPDRLAGWRLLALGGLEAALLVAIVVADPGRIDRRSGVLRGLSVGLTSLLLAAATAATVNLVVELVRGDSKFSSAGSLLVTGALVWLDANLTFSLLYWELDGGGPAQRLHAPRRYPDLAFPQQINPDLSPPGWRPTFVDYLYLGLTNALAFSPTDVMPTAHWSKLTMAAHSLISLAILSLVIASAVNILG